MKDELESVKSDLTRMVSDRKGIIPSQHPETTTYGGGSFVATKYSVLTLDSVLPYRKTVLKLKETRL
jgi:hypothetical protein